MWRRAVDESTINMVLCIIIIIIIIIIIFIIHNELSAAEVRSS